MSKQIPSIILASLLFLALFNAASDLNTVLASGLVLIVTTFAFNLKRLGWSWPHLLLPVLFLVAVNAIFVLLPHPTFRLIFLIISTVLFYFLENQLGGMSHFLQNIYLLSVFAIFLGLFAVQFYFHLNVGWLVIFIFVASFLLIVQGFAGFSLPAKKYFSFLVALIISEVAWGVSLWPTHFLVNAVVVFCAFYLLWFFAFSAFFGKLSAKKIYWQLVLVGLVLALTLGTAAWKPLVR